MGKLNDTIRSNLSAQGYKGTVNDMLNSYLASLLGVTSGSLDDKMRAYLSGLGYKGTTNDMLMAYAYASGYTSGALNDRLIAQWAAGAWGIPTLYDQTVNTPYFGRQTIATIWSTVTNLQINDVNTNGTVDTGDRVCGASFPTVNISQGAGATIRDAYFYITPSAYTAGTGTPTFRVFGRSPSVGGDAYWQTGNEPWAGGVRVTAVASSASVTMSSTSRLTIDVTNIVKDIINAANWGAGQTLNLWMEIQNTGGIVTFGTAATCTPRLQIRGV